MPEPICNRGKRFVFMPMHSFWGVHGVLDRRRNRFAPYLGAGDAQALNRNPQNFWSWWDHRA